MPGSCASPRTPARACVPARYACVPARYVCVRLCVPARAYAYARAPTRVCVCACARACVALKICK